MLTVHTAKDGILELRKAICLPPWLCPKLRGKSILILLGSYKCIYYDMQIPRWVAQLRTHRKYGQATPLWGKNKSSFPLLLITCLGLHCLLLQLTVDKKQSSTSYCILFSSDLSITAPEQESGVSAPFWSNCLCTRLLWRQGRERGGRSTEQAHVFYC